MSDDNRIVFDNVSKFYGEVLGVNRVSPFDPAGNHEPGRAERLRQDHADEPDDRADPPDARSDPRARDLARRPGGAVPPCSATARSSIRFPAGLTGYEFIYSYLRCTA